MLGIILDSDHSSLGVGLYSVMFCVKLGTYLEKLEVI